MRRHMNKAQEATVYMPHVVVFYRVYSIIIAATLPMPLAACHLPLWSANGVCLVRGAVSQMDCAPLCLPLRLSVPPSACLPVWHYANFVGVRSVRAYLTPRAAARVKRSAKNAKNMHPLRERGKGGGRGV